MRTKIVRLSSLLRDIQLDLSKEGGFCCNSLQSILQGYSGIWPEKDNPVSRLFYKYFCPQRYHQKKCRAAIWKDDFGADTFERIMAMSILEEMAKEKDIRVVINLEDGSVKIWGQI